MQRPIDSLDVGDYLWDMHHYPCEQNSLWIVEPHTIMDMNSFNIPNGSEFIQGYYKSVGLKRTYVNKTLVIIEKDYRNNQVVLKCMWSYDDRIFGTMRVEVDVA